MRRLPLACLAATALVAAAPQSPKGYGELRISKAALPGEQVRVWWAMLLNPDCTAAGTMTTTVVEPPRHGQVALSDDAFYPSYPPMNPRSRCDTQKAPGKQAFYTSDPAFHGHDRMVLQNATSEGRVRKLVIDVAVQ